MTDKELEQGAIDLLGAAKVYFRLMQNRGLAGGTIWLIDSNDAMVVFTRGEYRAQLLKNIETIYDGKRNYQFGVAE